MLHRRKNQRYGRAADQHDGQHQPSGLKCKAFCPLTQAAVTCWRLITRGHKPAQQHAITLGNASQRPLHSAVKTIWRGIVLEQQCAQHGGQRQRDDARHHHRTRQRQRKLDKQPPSAPGCKCQRRIHSHQRRGHGDDGKANLARPFDARRKRIHAFFNMAINVFQHHDGVIHHQANGQHQRQQREGVDREARQRHQGKGANQADRNRDDGNDRSTQRSQKHKNHEGDQQNRFHNGFVNIVD